MHVRHFAYVKFKFLASLECDLGVCLVFHRCLPRVRLVKRSQKLQKMEIFRFFQIAPKVDWSFYFDCFLLQESFDEAEY